LPTDALDDGSKDSNSADVNVQDQDDNAGPSSSVGFTREERKLQQVLGILGRSEGSPPRQGGTGKRRGRPPKSAKSSNSSTGSVGVAPAASAYPGTGYKRDKASGRTLLHKYAGKGAANMVSDLIASDPTLVFVPDNAGYTPLHEAALKGQEGIVRILLDNGAIVSARANNGETPLHDAAENGHAGVCRLLVRAGADLFMLDQEGRRPADVVDPDDRALVALLGGPDAGKQLQPPLSPQRPRALSDTTPQEPAAKRRPGRPRKSSYDVVPQPPPILLFLFNVDGATWHFLSSQLEEAIPNFTRLGRRLYVKELTLGDRQRILNAVDGAVQGHLQAVLSDEQRSVYFVDKDGVYRHNLLKGLSKASIQYVDVSRRSSLTSHTNEGEGGTSPPTAATMMPSITTAVEETLPLKFKMKQKWKLNAINNTMTAATATTSLDTIETPKQ
jgi:hypothetical protein